MKNDEIKKLAILLTQAESEEDVINILDKAGFWLNKKS